MNEIDLLIADNKRAIEINPYRINTGLLPAAIERVEQARAALADLRNHLGVVILGMERTLETGKPLIEHGFNDRSYSKGSSWCAAVEFRSAIADLRQHRAEFNARVEEHQRALRRMHHRAAVPSLSRGTIGPGWSNDPVERDRQIDNQQELVSRMALVAEALGDLEPEEI